MTKDTQCYLPTLRPLATAVAVTCAVMATPASMAQDVRQPGTSALLEEIVITARKREEASQSVPLSVSAFNAEQIDVLKVRDLTNLRVGMPNVSLEDIGTTRGTANFSIRGLGVNSSIPSIDPTVGVFVDGVYLGLNNGIVFDMFDLESVEVLRGPQGTLFGRNVTGGAVLLNTKKPGDELEVNLRTALETGDDGGLNRYYMGAIGGPINDTLGGRLVLYYNDDDGRFTNLNTGSDFGAMEQVMARGTLVWNPAPGTEITLMGEYNDTDGEGPAAQSHINGGYPDLGADNPGPTPGANANFNRDSFDFSIDEEGYQLTETNFFTARIDQDVDFGDGTITGILGYRDFTADSLSDIDAQPVWLFHAPANLEAEQTSFELRYNGTFNDRYNVTVGTFIFQNDVNYHERRNLLGAALVPLGITDQPAARFDGGGEYEVDSYTVFAQVDYDLTDRWTLTAGLNFSAEEKSARIASLSANASAFPNLTSCNVVTGPACPFDFVDDNDWDNLAPKLGASYLLEDNSQVYAHWTRGFRSGGYNLRNTSFNPLDTPGPFNEEEVNNFEIGYKSTYSWGRLNAAIFQNQIDDMQRELNLPNQGAGVVQLVRNTADATLTGIEVDGMFSLTDNLLLLASVGYIDAEYDTVREDLSTDGVIDGTDLGLALPRAPELTWNLGLTHDYDLGSWGFVSSRISYAYRDEMAFTDSNLGFIDEIGMLDAGLDFYSNDGFWVFSLYGRNLLDEANHGGDTQLPPTIGGVPVGGTFSPLMPGIRYGAEVTYNFR